MKRITSVFFAVLLGGLAVAIGTVPYLALANRDRNELANQLQSASMHVSRVEDEKVKIVEDANQKVQEANAEVANAQAVLSEAQQDQQLMAIASHLSPPPPQLVTRWNTVVSLPLGLSLRTPPDTQVIDDTVADLSIGRSTSNTRPLYSNTIPNDPWFIALPFSTSSYASYASQFSSSTNVAYIVGGSLLKGAEGTLFDGSRAAVFNVRANATSTHLLWIHEIPTIQFPGGIERVLSTMRFDK